MKHTIEKLECLLDELKEKAEVQEKLDYERKEHKVFKEGDWVARGDLVGTVGWVENKRCSINLEDGYMGVSIKNGTLGFLAGCKRDDFELLDCGLKEFYTSEHHIEFSLTGEEVSRLVSNDMQRNINPSTGKDKILDALLAQLPS